MDRGPFCRSKTVLRGRGLLRKVVVDLNPGALAIYPACPFVIVTNIRPSGF